MATKKEIRNKWLTIRLNAQEHAEFQRRLKNTTYRKASDYIRKLILNKPVNVKYRNASVDAFLSDMLALKKDLNGVANNFNQAVHKLHMLDHIPEYRHWAEKNEQDKVILFAQIDMILKRVNEIYKTGWSQS